MTRLILALAALCLLGGLQAGPITYSLTTTATGTLNGNAFTNALVTVTVTGDTANVTPGPDPFSDTVQNFGTAVVTVAGLGSGTFLDPTKIISSLTDNFFGSPGVIIVDDLTGTGILLHFGAEFLTYDLGSAIGPLSGDGGPASGSKMTPHFPTSGGDFTWAIGQDLGASTFLAVTSTTPEPGTVVLLSTGFAAMFVRRRFRA